MFTRVIVLAFALAAESVSAAPGESQAIPIRGNKQGAVVFTADDGLLKSVRIFAAEWRKHGLRGTAALNPGAIRDWQPWRDMVQEGILDIGNHGFNHINLQNLSSTEPGKLSVEVNDSRAALEKNIPGLHVLTMLVPEGAYNDAVIGVVQQQHVANRVVDRGYNSFGPTASEIYRLKRQQILAATTAAVMNGWVEEALRQGRWLIEAYHGCDGEGWESPPCGELSAHYAYVATRKDKLWVAGFQEIIEYIKERMAAQIQVLEANGTRIRLGLTDGLDNTLFDTPLTLRTEVDMAWKEVTVVQGARVQKVLPVTEAGKNQVYYEAVPDQGDIELMASGPTSLRGTPRAAGMGGEGNSVRVYDAGGRLVGSMDLLRYHRLGLAGLKPGLYFLKSGAMPAVERKVVAP